MKDIIELIPQLLDGLGMTMTIFGITLVIAIPLGIIFALGRLSKNPIISRILEFYILLMRGTPLLLQIVFVFFGLPLIGIVFDRMNAALIAFILNYAAYFAEIFRAGIVSIEEGQFEAAKVLGLSKRDTFIRIILPQAIKRILPAVSNEVTTLVKDTALVYVVGLDELLKMGKIASNTQASLFPLVAVAIIYLFLVAIFTKIFNFIEARYNYYA